MTMRKKNRGILKGALMLLALCAGVSLEAQALTISIYRGVDRNPDGSAVLTPNQFIFNGTPSAMSTFMGTGMAPVEKPCLYRYTVTVDTIEPGVSGPVAELPPNTFAQYDNNPEGHWGIFKPVQDPPMSNGQAGIVASNFALALRENVVDGTEACH